jgi:predicted transcriptional regulator
MFGFSRRSSHDPQLPILGPFETQVMEILWTRGKSSVHDVVSDLAARKRAYTTVMTTLDRLFKKGLLERTKSERAFIYSPRFSRQEWEHHRAGDLVARFLSSPRASSGELVSCLVDAVAQRDEALLDELERKIKLRRRELARGKKA